MDLSLGRMARCFCVPTAEELCDLAAIQAMLEASAAEAPIEAEVAPEPVEAEAAVEPAEAEAVAEPAEVEVVVEPAEAELVAEPVEPEGVVEPAEIEPAAEPAEAEAEAEAEPVAEPVEAAATDAPVEDEVFVEEAAPIEDVLIVEPVADPAPEPVVDPVEEAAIDEGPAPEPLPEMAVAEPAAEVIAEPVDVPVVSEEAATSLADILTAPAAPEAEAVAGDTAPAETAAPVAAAAEAAAFLARDGAADGTDPVVEISPELAAELAPLSVQTDIITEDNTRTSDQEFIAAPVAVAGGKKSGLSDLEKVGLLALGALVVGSIINEGKKDERKVVSNSGDRVVVQNADGTYVVYKDDDAILRRPGVRTVTETYRDGSTRTVVQRANGTEVVTIRDASGRVLRRATYDQLGNEIILIDDLAPEERIDITTLPRPKPGRVTISTASGDAALKAEMVALEAESLGRKFSLRQIREIPQVRALAAMIEVDSITFDSGSAGINATEARKLADIGRLMEELLAANPAEVFLIEGHTDAVGSAVSNLSLSDRRAESLALALTEYFGIPPENLVIQGYGESELKVESEGDVRENRRVVVRLVTPLMRVAELR